MPEFGNGLDELARQVEAALRSRGCKQRGDELLIRCLCPGHNDQTPSASYNTVKRCWVCHGCGADGGLVTGVYPIAKLLDIELRDNGNRSSTQRAPSPKVTHSTTPVPQPQAVSTTKPRVVKETQWDVPDFDGSRTFSFHRKDFDHGSKECWWDCTDTTTGRSGLGMGGRKPNSLPLYGWQDLEERTAGDDSPLILAEGAKCCDLIRSLGLRSLGTMTGANVVPGSAALKILEGEHVVFCRDNDGSGLKHAEGTALALGGIASSAMVFLPPGLTGRGDDIEQWIDAGKAAGKDTDQIRHELLLAIEKESYNPTDKTPVKASQGLKPVSSVATHKPFPVSLLPEPFKSYVPEVSRAIGCDPSMVVLSGLVALAAAVGNKRVVRIKNAWWEPSIQWGCIVAGSGTKKSPAMSEVLAPLRDFERENLKVHQQLVELFEDDLEEWNVTAEPDRARKFPNGEPQPPAPCERLVVADITREAVAMVHENSPAGLLVARDELGGWIGSFDAYKSGGGDAAFWIQVYGARPISVDRKGRGGSGGEHVFVERGSVSVIGSIQPGSARRALKVDTTQEHLQNGLAARILWVMPPRTKRRWTDDDINDRTRLAWHNTLTQLAGLSFDDGTPLELDLDADAKAAFVDHYNDFGERMDNESEEVEASISKLEGGAARLALTFQLMTNPESRTITLPMMEAGIAAARWFADEASRVFTMLTETEHETERRVLVEWIERHGGWVTKRKLTRTLSRYYNPKDAQKALDNLGAQELGEWHTRLPGPSGGRSTRDFVLNTFLDNYTEWRENNE